jgi:hypothetical protein
VVAKVRERLAVNKQRSHNFHMERFNLKKLNEEEVKEQIRVEALQWYSKCYCVASVTKTFTLKGAQITIVVDVVCRDVV